VDQCVEVLPSCTRGKAWDENTRIVNQHIDAAEPGYRSITIFAAVSVTDVSVDECKIRVCTNGFALVMFRELATTL